MCEFYSKSRYQKSWEQGRDKTLPVSIGLSSWLVWGWSPIGGKECHTHPAISWTSSEAEILAAFSHRGGSWGQMPSSPLPFPKPHLQHHQSKAASEHGLWIHSRARIGVQDTPHPLPNYTCPPGQQCPEEPAEKHVGPQSWRWGSVSPVSQQTHQPS